jgi:hypothetical protein
MKILRTYRLSWWQLGILKLALLSIGILFGVYFRDFFVNLTMILVVIAILASVYSWYAAMKS